MTLTQRRFAAWLIDLVLALGLNALFHGPLGWLLAVGYWLARDGLFDGQSVGKRLMGLRVVLRAARTRCTIQASVIRNVLWLVPFINLAMAATALFEVLTEAQARHWGDRLASTRLVGT